MPTPFVLGSEGSGVVSAVGADVTDLGLGQRVAWAQGAGSYAEQVVVRAAAAVPVPDALADDVAAGALLQGMTAHYLLNSTYPVQPGDTVVVHAAAGGVGLLLTQLAKAKGARVIGTVGPSSGDRTRRRWRAQRERTWSSATTASPTRSAGSPTGSAYPSSSTASERQRSTAASPRCDGAGCSCCSASPAGSSHPWSRGVS